MNLPEELLKEGHEIKKVQTFTAIEYVPHWYCFNCGRVFWNRRSNENEEYEGYLYVQSGYKDYADACKNPAGLDTKYHVDLVKVPKCIDIVVQEIIE